MNYRRNRISLDSFTLVVWLILRSCLDFRQRLGHPGPVPLVLDLRIAHERFGSSSDPSINGHLHYPNDVDRSLNEDTSDKIGKNHSDHNNNPPNDVSFMPAIASTSGRLHSEFVRLLFLQAHRETDRFFIDLGVQVVESNNVQFHYLLVSFSSQMKFKCENILAKVATLRISLNIDGVPVTSRSHTHPSHLQTSRLCTSSQSCVPVSRSTQCVWDV
jgi:hypothetical protein